MAIHTFGEYPDKFHPHLHAIVTDGLFRDTGTFYVMRDVDISPLENLFRAEVFRFLKKEGKITTELIQKLMAWRHSGFSIDNGVRIKKEDTKGREAIAQYIIRNVFNIKKVRFVEKTQKVIYQGRMNMGKNRKNFEVYSALEFMAAITQHIPNKFSQLSRYFGFYSNKSRGMRAKAEQIGHTPDTAEENDREEVNIIDVSKYQPKKVPSLTWCECIKKIWKDDPLVCPECMGPMKIIAFITEGPIIRKILRHLGLWDNEPARAPPPKPDTPEIVWIPIEDAGWAVPDQPDIVG